MGVSVILGRCVTSSVLDVWSAASAFDGGLCRSLGVYRHRRRAKLLDWRFPRLYVGVS